MTLLDTVLVLSRLFVFCGAACYCYFSVLSILCSLPNSSSSSSNVFVSTDFVLCFTVVAPVYFLFALESFLQKM
jgi:hypothetical protein